MTLTTTATTRSALTPTHLLHTPESFVRTPMPGITDGVAIVHACPALGAGFIWYTAELTPGGALLPCAHQRFLYVLSGCPRLRLERENYADHEPPVHDLRPGSYAYLPPGEKAWLECSEATRVAVIEKMYESLDHADAPGLLIGNEADVTAQPLAGPDGVAHEALHVRALLPSGPAHDFAVNTMAYAPGAALPQVEVHYMEHGLLMLEGDGMYLLDRTWYPVAAGDFIWMAPFCPQQFVAAAGGAKYLIYKNFNRTPAL